MKTIARVLSGGSLGACASPSDSPGEARWDTIAAECADWARQAIFRVYRDKAGEKRAAVIGALDEGVDGVAVRSDRGEARFALIVADRFRFADAARPATGRLAPRRLGVVNPEGDVANTVDRPSTWKALEDTGGI